ncbi:MAG: hypothetical protein M0024_01430 [Nitrospiraceae bacterium]|nr:hypothetical protein [Nitrospiraceae bacterium]
MVVDPQRQAWWQELRSLENGNPCCQALKKAIADDLKTWTLYDKSGRPLLRAEINYCPKCGSPVR